MKAADLVGVLFVAFAIILMVAVSVSKTPAETVAYMLMAGIPAGIFLGIGAFILCLPRKQHRRRSSRRRRSRPA